MKKKVIKKILIANRGEIALRVIKTCKLMGIETVSIYREDELNLPHRLLADHSVCLGDGSLGDTYLNINKIIEIAKALDVDAIHPGYGFLSENAEFANALESHNIVFIGPSAESMALMGDKKASKQMMEKLGVPLVPGYHGDNQDGEFLKNKANEIGYPLLIKASAGGGGKGMRIVNSTQEFDEALAAAKREAMNAFGDDKVLLEKYITSPRHIEVQVMSDAHGKHLHFFERECSIQRRHQKIVEETPSQALDEKKRLQMCQEATKITKFINYLGAGTVEFIFDQDDNFYFLEMNTRLQVEHPITEMVTGHDLVALQILVAQGEELAINQEDITQRGHAIEVRLYAEDPDNEFMPSIGTIEHVGEIVQNNARLDSGYIDGNEVTINYDPMLAKLICWAPDRQMCTQNVISCLNDTPFLGVKNNRNYLQRVLAHPAFEQGKTYTDFVQIHREELMPLPIQDEDFAVIAAANTFAKIGAKQNGQTQSVSEHANAWASLPHFRNS